MLRLKITQVVKGHNYKSNQQRVLLLAAWMYVVVLLFGVCLWLICQPVHVVANPPTRIHACSEFFKARNTEIPSTNVPTIAEGKKNERETTLSIVAWPWETIAITAETLEVNSPPIGIRSSGEAAYRQINIPEGYSTLKISPSDRLKPLVQSFLKGSLLIMLALIVICAGYWIGLSFSWLLAGASTERTVQSEITAVLIGLFGTALLFGSLAYFLSARYVGNLALTLALICAIQVRGAIPTRMFAGMIPALPALILSFWPIFLVGGDFLGLYQTDMFEYSTLVSFLTNSSLFEIQALQDAQQSGLITSGAGFTWRSIDSVMAATLGSLFGIGSRSALTLTAIVFYLLYVCAIQLFLELIKAPLALKVLGVAAASLSPALTALYTAGYYSHFIFACVMPATIVMVVPVNNCLSQNIMGNRASWPSFTAWLLAVAVGMAVYPYFMVITLTGVGIFLLWRQRSRFKQAAIVGLYAAIAVLLTMNMNCLSLLGYFKTQQFQGALDSLAQHTLMSGLTIQSFVHFLLGGRAYGARSADIIQFSDGLFTSIPWPQGPCLVSGVWFYAYLTIFLMSCVVALRAARRSEVLLVILFVTATWLAVFLWFYSQDRHYIYLKAGWTGATILPLFGLALAKQGAIRPALGMVMVVLLSVSWVCANAIDKYPYAANDYSVFSKRSHVGLLHDIKLIDGSLRQYSESHTKCEVSYRYGDEDLRGTDRDRVLFAHARVIERGLGLINTNSNGISIPDEASPSADILITIGRDLRPPTDSDMVLVAHGIHTSIYRREKNR